MNVNVHRALFLTAKNWKQHRRPETGEQLNYGRSSHGILVSNSKEQITGTTS